MFGMSVGPDQPPNTFGDAHSPAGPERSVATDVIATPPTDAEHDPVREGIRRGAFDPQSDPA